MDTETTGRPLKTIERAIDIVEFLRERDGARTSEVANRFDLSPATAHNYLSTLQHSRFLVREGNEYQVGLRFLNIGGYVRSQRESYNLARPKVKRLSDQTGERAQLLVEEHGQAIVLCKEVGENAVIADTVVGKTSYIHSSAAGKAILSEMTEEQVEKIVANWGLPPKTKNTITEVDDLFEELDNIRERGYAINNEESINGLYSVGASITKPDGSVLGALSVSGPTHRMKDKRTKQDIANMLLGATNEIELNLTYGQGEGPES